MADQLIMVIFTRIRLHPASSQLGRHTDKKSGQNQFGASLEPDFIQNYFLWKRVFDFFDNRGKTVIHPNFAGTQTENWAETRGCQVVKLMYSLSCSSIILFFVIVFVDIVILKSENL